LILGRSNSVNCGFIFGNRKKGPQRIFKHPSEALSQAAFSGYPLMILSRVRIYIIESVSEYRTWMPLESIIFYIYIYLLSSEISSRVCSLDRYKVFRDLLLKDKNPSSLEEIIERALQTPYQYPIDPALRGRYYA
jgi:hypothetical protein